jgi:hypothetical protein
LETIENRDALLTDNGTREADWLANAHKELDEAVAAADGWPADLSEEEVLKRLFDLNTERAKLQASEDGNARRLLLQVLPLVLRPPLRERTDECARIDGSLLVLLGWTFAQGSHSAGICDCVRGDPR